MNKRRNPKKDMEISKEDFLRGSKIENTLKKSIDKKNNNASIKDRNK